ncbi:hypothetical protein Hanom_Chr14g01331851 [Helianthus anomalus]
MVTYKLGKITNFVLYLYITFQGVSFLTNVDRRYPLLGILLQVWSFTPNPVKNPC